jgi:hypothetical protein
MEPSEILDELVELAGGGAVGGRRGYVTLSNFDWRWYGEK